MKRIFIFAIALVSLLAFASCEKFLDVQPEGTFSTTSYFQNDEQSINAIKVLYQNFPTEKLYGRDIFWDQCGTNMYVPGKTRGFPSLFYLAYTGDEDPLKNSFNYIYEYMKNANWIISSLLSKCEGDATKLTVIEKRTLGEAYFFRGYYHFLAAYRYGTPKLGVPFVRWEQEGGYNNEIPPQLESVMKNYEWIVDDFAKAEDFLPLFDAYGAEDRGRAHKAAACGMMARAYAFWAANVNATDKTKWDEVINCVNKLETTYGRKLASNYDDLFAPDWDKYWNAECIFSIPSNGGGTTDAGTMFPNVPFYNGGFGGAFNSWGQFKPTYDLYEEFTKDNAANDPQGKNNIRLKRTVLSYGDTIQYNGERFAFYEDKDLATGYMCGKYREVYTRGTISEIQKAGLLGTNGDWPTMRTNFHVIRMADCMLLRAEAYLAKGQENPKHDINAVRARVNLPAVAEDWNALYHERMCEFAFEPISDHLGDLRRWILIGDATIKNLAIKELTTHPRVMKYEDRSNPASAGSVQPYEDYKDQVATWADHKVVFPYPSAVLANSAGQYRQNDGY